MFAQVDQVPDFHGYGPILSGVGATIIAMVLAYFRGARLLGPVVAAVEWFRFNGAATLDLKGFGLTTEQEERIRGRVQVWLWDSLRDAIASMAAKVGLLGALDARVRKITEALKVPAPAEGEKAAPPASIDATAVKLKRATGIMAAFRGDEPSPASSGGPPVLGRARSAWLAWAALLALAAYSLVLSGCVAHEVPRAAERLAATAQVIHEAAAAHADLAALPPDEAAAALAGFQGLAAEHEAYARELVAAAGGDPARVRDLVAEWYEKAAARRRARLREAAERAAAVTETAVPR